MSSDTDYCTHAGPGCDRGCKAKFHASRKAGFEDAAVKFAKDKTEKAAKAAADLERSTTERWTCEDPSYVMAKQLEAEAKAK